MEQEKKNQNQPAAQEVSVGDQIKVRDVYKRQVVKRHFFC